MFFKQTPQPMSPLRQAINDAYRMDETACVKLRLAQAALDEGQRRRIDRHARELVAQVRAKSLGGSLDAFMDEYDLSSEEGVALMCLAEALLRIPDNRTADLLIHDLIGGAHWERHLKQSHSLFVNASTWALMLTGRLIAFGDGGVEIAQNGDPKNHPNWRGTLLRLVTKSSEPVIREAVRKAIRIMGQQFVMGQTVDEALDRATTGTNQSYIFSFDMLGEAARTMADADRYFGAYQQAIDRLRFYEKGKSLVDAPGISVKLSALHPRYEFAKADRVNAELLPRIRQLAIQARGVGISLTIDAEEADRLDLSLDIIDSLAGDPALSGWDGLGLAVQSYLKRALPTLEWLVDLGRRHRRRFMVRLVKGAYWDTEIKRSQEGGLAGYPVFTRKASTDVSYIACAKHMLRNSDVIYSAFATHNAHTLATVIELLGDNTDIEFQRLHGMGDALFDPLVTGESRRYRCRIYAPVGSHEDLLAYLVRRLLENGANSSFVNRVADATLPVEDIIADPMATVAAFTSPPHPRLPLPRYLFGEKRLNSKGIDLTDRATVLALAEKMGTAIKTPWTATPLLQKSSETGQPIGNPSNRCETVGHVIETSPTQALAALDQARSAQPAWDRHPAEDRAAILDKAAGNFERNIAPLMALAVKEAGKTIDDAVAEVREAVDFLRYYAMTARRDFTAPELLDGPTGELNRLSLHGRGVFLCISPWNFPLAIFTGQIAAALAAGNTVLAKPAEQTPLIAAEAVRLLYDAGLPQEVLQFLPGDGPGVAGPILRSEALGGVAFTGSTETARVINRQLAAGNGPIAPLIAETGGQNAMIVDSSALPEQVTRDVIASAFRSAGQRCSALRVLFVQEEIAERLLTMIAGAMAELEVGDPALLSTDVGPVIDQNAHALLLAHGEHMARTAKLLGKTPLPRDCEKGFFISPQAFEIQALGQLKEEVFGPILHVIRFNGNKLDRVVDGINRTGFGLTLGIHSRIGATIERIKSRVRVGNVYINRNQIGAMVGIQPFGGEGLSGTGPKAGGPRYLHRFATERTESIDTTAAGGNASLMTMSERGD